MMVLLGREGAGKLWALEHQGMVTSAILLDISSLFPTSNNPRCAKILEMGGYILFPSI